MCVHDSLAKGRELDFLVSPLYKGGLRGVKCDENYGIPLLSNWTKIFTVIAREGKQSQPLELLHFTSFHMANATQRLYNNII